ncbi:MAG: ribosome biogenesis GTPase Der [Calditrichota bacterium]
MPLPIVAIVGRPNVGKSSLFNRVIRRQAAVVDPQPGVTRDRHYAEAEWDGVCFMLVDTGGWLPPGDGDDLTDAVREQTMIASEEADILLFLADAQSGPTDVDQSLARLLRRGKAPILLLANKVDDPIQIGLGYEIAGLGLGEPLPVSAKSGHRIGDMLDSLVRLIRELKPTLPESPAPEILSLAIIGAPNSGKSSLVNRLTGDNRMVVSDIPGTTRDAVDALIKYHGDTIRLIDTAGLRRKRYGQQGLDFYITLRALRAIERADVAAVLIDGTRELTQGDIKLVNQAAEMGAGVIAAVNKWDAVEKDPKSADRWIAEWRWKAPRLSWTPVIFISALTGQRAIRVIERALQVKQERERRISTSELNDAIVARLIQQPPPAVKGKFIHIKYGSQVGSAPPRFAFFTSHADLVGLAYRRFVEKLIRERFGFEGTPIRIVFKEK